MHTEFSDGDSTIEEYAERARTLGLEEIAITDHCWRSSDWIPAYVEELRAVNDRFEDLTIHAGLEAKLIDRKGAVDVANEDAELVDFVMGVVHRYQPDAEPPFDDLCNFEPSRAAELERDYTLELANNPEVDVIGHPSRTYYKFHYDRDTEHYPREYYVDMCQVARRTGTPLEYNARLPVVPRRRLLSLYVARDVPFTTGSDSHAASQLDTLDLDTVEAAV